MFLFLHSHCSFHSHSTHKNIAFNLQYCKGLSEENNYLHRPISTWRLFFYLIFQKISRRLFFGGFFVVFWLLILVQSTLHIHHTFMHLRWPVVWRTKWLSDLHKLLLAIWLQRNLCLYTVIISVNGRYICVLFCKFDLE